MTQRTEGRPLAAQGKTRVRTFRDNDWLAQSARRMRIAARCLGLYPVFVDDGAMLAAELFDSRGRHAETWKWSPGVEQ